MHTLSPKFDASFIVSCTRLARAFLGFTEKTIILPGYPFPVCYMERGDSGSSKKTILFIHGFSAMKEFVSLIASYLPKQEYHVIAIDLPGHGKSGIDDNADIGVPYYVNLVKKVKFGMVLKKTLFVVFSS